MWIYLLELTISFCCFHFLFYLPVYCLQKNIILLLWLIVFLQTILINSKHMLYVRHIQIISQMCVVCSRKTWLRIDHLPNIRKKKNAFTVTVNRFRASTENTDGNQNCSNSDESIVNSQVEIVLTFIQSAHKRDNATDESKAKTTIKQEHKRSL